MKLDKNLNSALKPSALYPELFSKGAENQQLQ